MCIEASACYTGPQSRVFSVWKACRRHGKRLYPLFQRENYPHPVGHWARAHGAHGSLWSGGGWHAYGSKRRAQRMHNVGSVKYIRVRVRGVIARNRYGDVRAIWMYISKREARRAQK